MNLRKSKKSAYDHCQVACEGGLLRERKINTTRNAGGRIEDNGQSFATFFIFFFTPFFGRLQLISKPVFRRKEYIEIYIVGKVT